MNGRYYEAHVTVDPLEGEPLAEFQRIADDHGFRVARLLMRKGRTPSTDDAFCTARSGYLTDIMDRTRDMVHSLRKAGLMVRRFKIEDTLLDSKLGDEL